MKKFLALLALSLALPAFAADPVEAGPRGGRLLALDTQKAEFFVEPDRTVSIAFYDGAPARVAPSGQLVVATAETPAGKTRLEFKPQGDLIVSTAPLPEGSGYTIVLQVRPSPEAKPKNFRITYQTHACDECKLPEYACTCNH